MDKQLEEQVGEIAREEAANRYSYNTAYHTRRIADTLEEILRLVKQDMERMKKLNDQKNFQSSDFNKSLALARGQWLQASSRKLQASSLKLDKTLVWCYRRIKEKEL